MALSDADLMEYNSKYILPECKLFFQTDWRININQLYTTSYVKVVLLWHYIIELLPKINVGIYVSNTFFIGTIKIA